MHLKKQEKFKYTLQLRKNCKILNYLIEKKERYKQMYMPTLYNLIFQK